MADSTRDRTVRRASSVKREAAAATALNPEATASERYDAQVDVTKSALGSLLIPSDALVPVIDYINRSMEEDAFAKSLTRQSLVPFPPKSRGDRGMQSIAVDEFQLTAQGPYWDRPGLLNFDSMRSMVEQTPLLNSIIMTRIRQVTRFCRPQTNQEDAGFVIEHVDKTVKLNDDQQKSVQLLQQFIINCGWETNPRRRKRLRRDSFAQFMAKSVRDSLSMDSAPIETEFKRDKALGLDGFYAVDGATIRLCTEDGYSGDDEVYALQVIDGRIRTAYTYEDLVYEPRNPRTDVRACGYGLGETEMLIRVVTYLLNTMTFNGSFFDKNSIPRGILHLAGNYGQEDLAAFRRYWMAMVKGMQNVHNIPVLVSKDQESKAEFTEVGGQLNEMAFGKWMSFLTSVACAVYGISPEEISMESYTAGRSALSGSDTEEKITSSNDKGLRPLLSYYESLISDFVIQEFSPQYMFRFRGLDGESEANRFEMKKLVLTWDEGRKDRGLDPVGGDLGNAPLNPALLSAWSQERQAKLQQQQEDFGTPPDSDEGEEPLPPEDGEGGEPGAGAPAPEPDAPDFGEPPGDVAKASRDFGMPIFSVEP